MSLDKIGHAGGLDLPNPTTLSLCPFFLKKKINVFF
jgi:hypothetical protein